MDKRDNLRALCFGGLAHLGQRNGIAAMQKQYHLGCAQFLGNGPTDATAGARDQIAFHKWVGRDRRARR